MRTVAGKVLFAALSVLYPGLVFCGLYFWGLRPRVLSIALLAIAFLNLIALLKTASKGWKQALKSGMLFFLALACGILTCATDSILSLKFYPVAVSIALLVLFGSTLPLGPSFVFKLACIGDKALQKSALRQFVEPYCLKVTIILLSLFQC